MSELSAVSLPSGQIFLFGFFNVFTSGKGRGTGIAAAGCQPETVHEVIIGAKVRQMFGAGAADKDGKGSGIG